MFKTVSDLQEFVVWASKHGIKRIKMKGIELEMSDISIAIAAEAAATSQQSEERDTSKTMVDTDSSPDTEDLLFWSASK